MILWDKWPDIISSFPVAPSHFVPTKEKQRRQYENNWKDLKIIYSLLLLQ